jgi:CHRD domain-containing protein
MQLIKLTAFSLIIIAMAFGLGSCEKDAERKKVVEYMKSGIPMTGAQENPQTPSTALGSLDVYYAKNSKTLTYKVTWQGLADTIVGMHIHGVAPSGYSTAIVQNILTTKNEAAFPFRGGTYSGTMLVDGVVIKEEYLLDGYYYLNIHSKTYPGGEIRGQIKFQ